MSFLSLPVMIMAGIAFYVGIYHLFIYLRRPQRKTDLTFALACFATGLYDIFCAGLYGVTSPQEGVYWQRLQIIGIGLASIALLWFVAHYTAQRSRKGTVVLSAAYFLLVIIAAVDRTGLIWTDEPLVKAIQLPFDISFNYYEMAPGPVTMLSSLVGLIMFAYICWSGFRLYSSGNRKKAVPLLLSILIFFLGVFNDSAVSAGIYDFIYMMEYSYLALILLMAFSLSNELVVSSEIKVALQESEKKYRELANSLPQAVFEMNIDGQITFVNQNAFEMFGYTHDDIDRGVNTFDMLVAADRERAIKNMHKRVAGERQGHHEYTAQRKDESTFPVMIHANPVFKEGKPIGFRGILIDITEQKRTEHALVSSEKRYRTLFEKSTDAIFIVEKKEGRYIDANEAALQLTGRKLPELVQLTTREVCPKDADKRIHKISSLNAAAPLGKTTYVRPDGSHRTAMLTTVPLDDNSVIGIARDITDELAREELLRQAQKMESIGTLAGGIAHDFNNILSAIIGFTEISLASVEEGSDIYDNLQEVFRATKRAADLVKHILAFSRQAEIERKPVQAKMIARETMKFLRSSLPTTIEVRPDIKCDSTIMADPTQVHQILMNLCTNAAHAMKEEGGVLGVRLEEIELTSDFTNNHADMIPGTYLNLTVSDTGHGMTPQVMERVFDPFFTTKEVGEGTGLGLSAIHGIVGSYGGAITVDSEPGHGCTFNVYLPVIEMSRQPKIDVKEPVPTGNECILYIDDEPPLANLNKKMLDSLGYEVEIRTSSIEAIELFKAQPDRFDLVITDMTMPNMTGVDLAEEMLRIRPEIPIILCTGYSAKIDEQQAKAMSFKAFIMKPVVKRDMAVTIRKVLDHRMDDNAADKILVIDDDVQLRTLLKQMLTTEGYEVVTASNGEEGVNIYKQNPTDLIITDIIMPGKEGINVIMELKKDFPEVKIIAISGGGEFGAERYLDIAAKLGARFTLAKPFERVELLAAVKELLEA